MVGIVVRRRYKSCALLLAYLGLSLVTDLLVIVIAPQLFTKAFWLAKELAINGTLLGVAFELGFRNFRAFPGARNTARNLLVVAMFATAMSILPVWPGDGNLGGAAVILQTRFLNGAVWLFSALAAVILWYRLPIDGFHKAILVGLVPYLLVSTAGLNWLQGATTPDTWKTMRPLVNNALATAYLVLVTYWAYAIWRPVSYTVQAGEPAPAAKNATQPL